MSQIKTITAREILDSRGNPTVEADVILKTGEIGRASVPSGASTGSREALEQRDKDRKRYQGKGVLEAVHAIRHDLAKALQGFDVTHQQELDDTLIALDGTKNKGKFGANALLAVSLAAAKAAAAHLKIPLYAYLGNQNQYVLPVPLMNIINGGMHADNQLDFQEFMILPIGFPNFSEALRAGVEVFYALKELLKIKHYNTNVGDEGGFAPNLSETQKAIELILSAIMKAGFTPQKEFYLGLDVASNELYREGKYYLAGENLTLIGFFPWVVFLPQTIKSIITPFHKLQERKIEIFFLLWTTLIFIFFSFSKSKLIPYILPAFPPLAILTAHSLIQCIKQKNRTWDFRLSVLVFVIISITIVATLISFVSHKILPHPLQAEMMLFLADFILILGATVTLAFAFLDKVKTVLSLIIFSAVFFIILISTVPFVDAGSVYPFANTLKSLLETKDTVVAYNQYYQDLPFYLGRKISILNWRNELTFGMQHQNQHDWLINDDQFWELWNSAQRVFVVLGLGEYDHLKKCYPQKEFYLLNKTVNNALIVNQPIDFRTQRKDL